MKTQLVCQKCGKPIKRKRKTNLCFECYSKRKLDSKYKLAISNGLKKFNSENPKAIELKRRKSEIMKGYKNPAKKLQARIKISQSKIGKKFSKEWKEKLSLSHIGNTNRRGSKCSELSKKRMRESHIKYMTSGKLLQKETSIEKKIKDELIKQKIIFKEQVPLCGISVVDFLLNKKVIIYCDGDYWHNRPEALERDKRQNKVLADNGYKVFRFWEHEINKSPSNCINKLKFLNL